jgi:hypothetical protein
MVAIPLSLIIAHFVGDWLLQSDWMALNKSKSFQALWCHVTVVGLTLFAWSLTQSWTLQMAVAFTFMNWGLHLVTDAFTSQLTSRLWFIDLKPAVFKWEEMKHYENKWTDFYHVTFKPTRHWFFVTIGFDQVLHYAAYAATLSWLT